MKKVIRCEIPFEQGYAYLFDSLDQVNELSQQVISLVDFALGRFFTIVDENFEKKNLCDFKYAVTSYGAAVQSQNVIFDIVSSIENISVWFDDFESDYKEGYDEAIFLEYGMYYGKEIYYQMTKETITKENIEKCFNYSNTFWHSLCVLSKTKIYSDEKKLSIEQIKQICLNAQLILICAYDADGYVFWERSNEYHPFISDLIL